MAMIRAARDARLPVLYQELGTPDFLPELNVYYEMLSEVLPLCDQVAALARRFSEMFGGRAPASVLPLMVEEPAPAERKAASDGVTFGFAARMEYGKAPLALVEAFACVCRIERTSLRMAGTGRQEIEVASLARTRARRPLRVHRRLQRSGAAERVHALHRARRRRRAAALRIDVLARGRAAAARRAVPQVGVKARTKTKNASATGFFPLKSSR